MSTLIAAITDESWILFTSCLVAVTCSQVGVFLVLKRQAMLGDAISHAILPGLIISFIWFHSRNIFLMLAGAVVVSLFATFAVTWVEKHGRQYADASLGIVFTFLFAIGVVLISAYGGHVDLDPDCVLFGEIAFIVFNRIQLNEQDFGPTAFWVQTCIFILVQSFILIARRRLTLICFDPLLANNLGLKASFWHYSIMTIVALACIGAFEAVGVILVIALLVCPANSAFLLARSLLSMQILSAIFALISAIVGYQIAAYLDNSIAACIALASGAVLISVIIFDKLRLAYNFSRTKYG